MSAPQLAPVFPTVDNSSADDRVRAKEMFAELAEGPPEGRRRDRVREQLITMHLPLVRFLARRYANRGEPLDDLVQAGCIGLVKAVDRFDPARQLGRSPTVAETAQLLGRTEEDVLAALDCASAYTADSFETPVGDELTLGDTLGGSDAGLDDVDMHESLRPLLDRLPVREQRILQLRFYGNHTQSQIAAELGISQMHVSRLLARTLAQLRTELLAER